MKRRDFIKTGALAAAGTGFGASALKAGQDQPNVLLILVDQLRQPRWTPHLRTPNIDRLASWGVSFSNHFVSASPCSPSRACILTGTYTTQNQMYSNCDFVEGHLQPSLDPRIPTTGHIFGKHGYQTPYRGKWHLTRRKDRNKKDPLLDYGYTGWKAPEAFFGGPPYCGAAYDPWYVRQTKDFLLNPDSHKQPWSLVCSLVNPHDICAYPRYYPQRKLRKIRTEAPPDNWTDDLSTKPAAQREHSKNYNKVGGGMDLTKADNWRRYLDYYVHCVEDVDANLGLVLDALEQSGQFENTIIAFTSDHGEMGGSHRLRTKGCFAYEEVMNVPLIFSWPGRIPAGQVAESFASNVDIVPTLASLAGLNNLPYLAGVDLTSVLKDPANASVRNDVIYHSDWEAKMTLFKDAEQKAIYDSPAHVRTIRDHEWKYSYYFAPGRTDVDHELYNMKDDPNEMVNLGNDPGYSRIRKELFERLMEQERQFDKDFEV